MIKPLSLTSRGLQGSKIQTMSHDLACYIGTSSTGKERWAGQEAHEESQAEDSHQGDDLGKRMCCCLRVCWRCASKLNTPQNGSYKSTTEYLLLTERLCPESLHPGLPECQAIPTSRVKMAPGDRERPRSTSVLARGPITKSKGRAVKM